MLGFIFALFLCHFSPFSSFLKNEIFFYHFLLVGPLPRPHIFPLYQFGNYTHFTSILFVVIPKTLACIFNLTCPKLRNILYSLFSNIMRTLECFISKLIVLTNILILTFNIHKLDIVSIVLYHHILHGLTLYLLFYLITILLHSQFFILDDF